MMVENKKSGDIHEYAEALYSVDSFSDGFALLEEQARKRGFHGALYTYIPQPLVDSNFSVEPVFELSEEYSPEFLDHYTEARFDRHDPLIGAVLDGVKEPIDWWGDICDQYIGSNSCSREMLSVSKDCGISNGITVPLLSGKSGIAGASFITSETSSYSTVLKTELDSLVLCTKLFHGFVSMDSGRSGRFSRTLLEQLNKTEKRLLIELAKGRAPCQIASILNKTEGYLEQVMLKMRRKLSGVSKDEPPLINRNQLMYYAGLLNVLDHSS